MSKQEYIEQLFNTMGQLKKLLEHQAQESHEERAATMMQFSALKFLEQNKDTTVGDIAGHLHLSKSSATQLIERMEKSGLVERIHDRADRRIVRLSITDAGQQQVAALRKKFIDKMSHIFSKVPDEDLQQLIRIHTDLISSLRKEQK